jgi:hypothetical protein
MEEVDASDERPVPEKWIGKEISLASVRADGSRRNCTLEEVNDRGVVVSYDRKTSFHPWDTIAALQLR